MESIYWFGINVLIGILWIDAIAFAICMGVWLANNFDKRP